MIFINTLYHDVILYIVSIAIVYLKKISFMSIFPITHSSSSNPSEAFATNAFPISNCKNLGNRSSFDIS